MVASAFAQYDAGKQRDNGYDKGYDKTYDKGYDKTYDKGYDKGMILYSTITTTEGEMIVLMIVTHSKNVK